MCEESKATCFFHLLKNEIAIQAEGLTASTAKVLAAFLLLSVSHQSKGI